MQKRNNSLNKKCVVRAANPKEVSYYFKEQSSHLTGEGPWTDEIFPPTKSSLLGLDKNGKFLDPDVEADIDTLENEIDANNTVWKRATEIFGQEIQLFSNGIEANDIQQGVLGTCYFLSALAALTEYPHIISDMLFKTKTVNERGIYEMVFFVDGDWMIVVVDDYFPIDRQTGELKFTRTNGKELWVILLEKAWAKVNGGYANISGGSITSSLFSLTGFPTLRMVHEEENNKQNIWNAILEAEQRDDIMCCSTYGIEGDDDPRLKQYEDNGLSPGHAYTLIGAKEVKHEGKTIKLCLIRNPHGVIEDDESTEWSGAWCDGDKRWTPELNRLFHHENKEDGCFWMDFDDFLKNFEDSFFCDILYDGKLNYFKFKDETLDVPNVINFHVEKDQKMIISVFRDTWRFVRATKYKMYPITMIIAKYDPKTGEMSNIDGQFIFDDSYEHIKSFEKGHYVVWTYYDLHNSCEPVLSEYVVRIASIDDFRTKEVGTDPKFELLTELVMAGMRENYDDSVYKTPTVMKIDSELRGTGIGVFYMQNNQKDSMVLVKGNMKCISGYRILGEYEGKTHFNISLNPGDARVIFGIRTPPTDDFSPTFDVARTVSNNPCSGQQKGKSKLFDVSKYLTDVSELPRKYCQIVNINKEQFKEAKELNKVQRKTKQGERINTEASNVSNERNELTKKVSSSKVEVINLNAGVSKKIDFYEKSVNTTSIKATKETKESKVEVSEAKVSASSNMTKADLLRNINKLADEESYETKVEYGYSSKAKKYDDNDNDDIYAGFKNYCNTGVKKSGVKSPTKAPTGSTTTQKTEEYVSRMPTEYRGEAKVTETVSKTTTDNNYSGSTSTKVYDGDYSKYVSGSSTTGATSTKVYTDDSYGTKYVSGSNSTAVTGGTTTKVYSDGNYVSSGTTTTKVYGDSVGVKYSGSSNTAVTGTATKVYGDSVGVKYSGSSNTAVTGTTTKVYDGDSYGTKYISGTGSTTVTGGTTTKVYDGDYSTKYVSGSTTTGATSTKVYDGDSYGTKYVSGTSSTAVTGGTRVYSDGNYVSGGTTSKTYTDSGDSTTVKRSTISSSGNIATTSKVYGDSDLSSTKYVSGSTIYGGSYGTSGATTTKIYGDSDLSSTKYVSGSTYGTSGSVTSSGTTTTKVYGDSDVSSTKYVSGSNTYGGSYGTSRTVTTSGATTTKVYGDSDYSTKYVSGSTTNGGSYGTTGSSTRVYGDEVSSTKYVSGTSGAVTGSSSVTYSGSATNSGDVKKTRIE
jgi:hypothetical protein